MLYKVLNNSEDKIKLIVPKDISHLLGDTILIKRRDTFTLDWIPTNKDDTRLIITPIIKQEEPKKQRLLVSEFKHPETKKDNIKTKGGRS